MYLSFSVDHRTYVFCCCCWRQSVPISAYIEAVFMQSPDRQVLIVILIESQRPSSKLCTNSYIEPAQPALQLCQDAQDPYTKIELGDCTWLTTDELEPTVSNNNKKHTSWSASYLLTYST